MGNTEQVIRKSGYDVEKQNASAYRGSPDGPIERMVAKKRETRWVVNVGERSLLSQIFAVQSAIPMAAQIEALIELPPERLVALIEFIPGTLLWEMENNRPSFSSVEQGLKEFIASLDGAGLVHGDIRPWNIFIADDSQQLRFIDWGFSFFRGQVMPKRSFDHLEARGHCGWPVTTIDRIDAERTLRVLLNPRSAEEQWNHQAGTFKWRPSCWVI